MLRVLKSSALLIFLLGTFMTAPSPAQKREATIQVKSFGINSQAAPHAAPEEDFLVQFGATGLRLFLRRLQATQDTRAGKKPVLFVHGATFPSALAAAFPFGGHSWMQDLSEAGFDAWALDFLGYGGADRYPEMSDGKLGGPPLLQTEEASRQIETAVEFIRGKTGMSKVSIIAHSWGTLPTGLFINRRPELVDRVVFFGPVAERHQSATSAHAEDSTAWNVTVEDQRKRFYGYVPRGQNPVLAKSDMDLWWPAYLATDPDSSKRTPPSVRVPRGPVTDVDLAWSGQFPYDPGKIPVPLLIVRGEWDSVTKDGDAHWLYENLRGAPIKRDVVISRGTHVMHLEASRYQLYRETQTFLEGRDVVQAQMASPISSHSAPVTRPPRLNAIDSRSFIPHGFRRKH